MDVTVLKRAPRCGSLGLVKWCQPLMRFMRAWMTRSARIAALLLIVASSLIASTARAGFAHPVAAPVTSNPEGLSERPNALQPNAAEPLRAPPVRADARRLRAPGRAQAQPSTHGPWITDRQRGSRRQWQARPTMGNGLYDFRARVWSTELGVFLQPDQYGYLSRGGTLWSWPGNNPFRWRDPYGRYGWEDLGNTFYKYS